MLRSANQISLETSTVEAAEDALKRFAGKLTEIELEFELQGDATLHMTYNGVPHEADASDRYWRIYDDTTITERFTDYGERMDVITKNHIQLHSTECSLKLTGKRKIQSLKIYELNSIWE